MKHIYTSSVDSSGCRSSPLLQALKWVRGGEQTPLCSHFQSEENSCIFHLLFWVAAGAGLEPLVLWLFVILALCGLCSAGFQEHSEAAGQGWRGVPALLFHQTPTNETGLCAPKHGKGRQRHWAPSLHRWTADLSAAVRLGNKSPTDPGCLWPGHGSVDLSSTQSYKKRWALAGSLEPEMLCVIENTNPNPWLSTAVAASC